MHALHCKSKVLHKGGAGAVQDIRTPLSTARWHAGQVSDLHRFEADDTHALSCSNEANCTDVETHVNEKAVFLDKPEVLHAH